MCTKCNNKECLVGEKCGNCNQSLLVEDGTMTAFGLNPFDTKVKVEKDVK